MKKILYSLIAILAIVMSSCSNDDIEVIKTGGVTFNVSTQSVYDDFGIAERFKSEYLSGSYKIGVYGFVYDENEILVASDSVYTQNFGVVPFKFPKLKVGTYTYVFLEMLINADNDNSSDTWCIVGKDKLSTLEILNKNYFAWWQSAVGLSTSTFEVNLNQDELVYINPKGIGCLIHSRFTNFDKSDYRYAAFLTKDQPKGRFLSPKFEGNDRFYYDKYNASNTWTARAYTWNKKENLSSSEAPYCYLLEEGTVKYCYGAKPLNSEGNFDSTFDQYGSSEFSVKDGQAYYAAFHYISKDRCASGFLSTLQEYQEWYKTYHDAVPYLSWGISSIVVDAYMKNDGMQFLGDGYDDDYTLYYSDYANNSYSLYYEYRFDVTKAKLASVLMTYSSDAYSYDEVLKQLEETYSKGTYSSENGGYMFNTDDMTIFAVNQEDNGTFVVLYISNEALSNFTMKKNINRSKNYRDLLKARYHK